MTTLFKYKIFCETENQYVYTWCDNTQSAPQSCPNNTSHTISNTMSISDKVVSNNVKIQSSILPNNNFMTESFRLSNILPNSTQSMSISYPFDISIITVTMSVINNNGETNDSIDTIIAPDTVIGVNTQTVNISDTVIHVSPTVIANVNVGHFLNITNGTNINNLGRIVSIDNVNSTVTIETMAANTFAPLSYIRLNVYKIKNLLLDSTGTTSLTGVPTLTSRLQSHLPIKLIYTNNSTIYTKSINLIIQYLY